jgi:hypothetical protein
MFLYEMSKYFEIFHSGSCTLDPPCKMGNEGQGKRQGRRETYVFLKLQGKM